MDPVRQKYTAEVNEQIMEKSRVEAFTDGILAIAATIMVLELAVPDSPTWKGLLENNAVFFAYVISFIMIYAAWHAHHDLFKAATVISSRAFLLNGLWILFVTLIPFATAWVGKNPASTVPEVMYALAQMLCTASFNGLRWQVKKDNPDVTDEIKFQVRLRIAGYFFYAICLIAAFIYPIFTLVFTAIVAALLLAGIFFKDSR